MAIVKALLLLAIVMAASLISASSDDGALARYPGRRTRRNRHRRRTPTPTPERPSPPPTPRVPSPPPSPPGFLLPCDRPDVPPVLTVTAGQNASGGGRDCIPRPAPPAPPQPWFRRPALCTCPKPPGFGAGTPGGGGAGGCSSVGDCVSPLALLMTCGEFITGATEETPTPHSQCCVGLASFLNQSTAATAAGGGLRCLCPVIVGDVNRVLPRPVDPVRLLYLPIACGIVLPPEILFMCFTGHPSPKAVDKFSELWVSDVHGG